MVDLRETIVGILYGWLIMASSMLPVLILILQGENFSTWETLILWLVTIIALCVLLTSFPINTGNREE